MYIFFCFITASIIYSILVLADHTRKQRKHPKENDIMALDITKEEYFKALNFMLLYGVITFEEYNKLELKSLPYLKG